MPTIKCEYHYIESESSSSSSSSSSLTNIIQYRIYSRADAPNEERISNDNKQPLSVEN